MVLKLIINFVDVLFEQRWARIQCLDVVGVVFVGTEVKNNALASVHVLGVSVQDGIEIAGLEVFILYSILILTHGRAPSLDDSEILSFLL